MPDYSIEARSLDIGGVASHNFLVLRNDAGEVLAELHGLATDRESGKVVPIGTDEEKYSLRAWHYPHDAQYAASIDASPSRTTYIQEGQASATLLAADREEILERWQSAVQAVQPLNELDLNYPNYGFRVFRDTVNSNSAFRTMSEIMGLPVHDFGGRMEPGLDNRMVPVETIEALRMHGYPVLDEASQKRDGKYIPLASYVPDRQYSERYQASTAMPDDPVFSQISDGVERMNAFVRDVPRETADRMTWRLYALAKETGMDRVDEVVLGRKGSIAGEGEYVFLVKGDPGSTIYERHHLRTADAVDTSVEQSRALAQVGEQQQQARSNSQQALLQDALQQPHPGLRA